jgi:hypothetical protein
MREGREWAVGDGVEMRERWRVLENQRSTGS